MRHSPRFDRWFVGMAAAAVLTGLVWISPSLTRLFTLSADDVQTLVAYRATVPATHPSLGLQLHANNVLTLPNGFILGDRKRESLVWFDLPESPDGTITLHLSAGAEAGQTVRLGLLNLVTGRSHPIRSSWDFHHQDVPLSPHLKGGTRWRLMVSASGDDRGKNFVIEEFVVAQVRTLPRLPRVDFFLAGLAALALLFRFRGKGRSGPALFPALKLTSADWLAGIVLLAFVLRWRLLIGSVGQPLEGDASTYLDNARAMSLQSPFSFGNREPLYIWLQALVGGLFGFHALTFRFVTVLLSTVNVGLTYAFIRRFTKSAAAALAGAAIFAVNRFAIWNSTRGERSELYLLLALTLLVLLLSIRSGDLRKSASAGLAGGLLSLTWLIGLLASVLAYPAIVVRRTKDARGLFIFLLVLAAVVSPLLLHHAKTSGDPFHPINAHTHFYRSVRETGNPGRTSGSARMFDLVVKEQGVKLLGQTARGYADIFVNPFAEMNKMMIGFTGPVRFVPYPFFLAGLISCFARKRWRYVLVTLAMLNVAPAFVHETFDPRLFLQAVPLAAGMFALGVEEVLRRVRIVA